MGHPGSSRHLGLGNAMIHIHNITVGVIIHPLHLEKLQIGGSDRSNTEGHLNYVFYTLCRDPGEYPECCGKGECHLLHPLVPTTHGASHYACPEAWTWAVLASAQPFESTPRQSSSSRPLHNQFQRRLHKHHSWHLHSTPLKPVANSGASSVSSEANWL